MKGFNSLAVHGPDFEGDGHGSLRTPLYDSVAFEYPTAKEMQLAFEGRKLRHSYSRVSNPTVYDLEQRVLLLSGALGVVAVSSGMAAISNILLALGWTGCNLVTTPFLFGNTYSLFDNTLRPWGLEPRFVQTVDASEIGRNIDENSCAVFIESISNPQLQVADVRAIASVAHERGLPLILDGTLTTPYLFRSGEHGADLEVISATKFFSGGATVVGGLIVDYGTFDWSKSPRLKEWYEECGPQALLISLRRQVYRNLGACLAPHNAWLQILAMETLGLRVNRCCENALEVARGLSAKTEVESVNYPGLPGSASYELARAQFPRGFGSVVTFELGDRDRCFRFMDALTMIRRATNMCDNKTLILHPASTIYCDFPAEQRLQMGVSESLLRLSVGIEDLEDIQEDLNAGFRAL
jgi:O-acetylhomoserine (thiol)-lyase